MAEIIDSRPKLVLIMGCNGCGKSAWKRSGYDSLPEIYFDQDSVAGGIGDWDNKNARERARKYVYEKIAECFEPRLDFGFESSFSGRPGVELLERAVANRYQVGDAISARDHRTLTSNEFIVVSCFDGDTI